MTLLDDLRGLRDQRVQQADVLSANIDSNAAQIEQLMAINAAASEAMQQLRIEIADLDRHIAQLAEHEAPPVAPQPTASESRREAEELVRERREAERETAKREIAKREQRFAASKQRKREAEEARKRAAASEPEHKSPQRKHPHTLRDPLHVSTKTSTSGKTLPAGIKRTRLTSLTPDDITVDFSATDLARADLMYDLMVENDGAMDQYKLGHEWQSLLDIEKWTTAQASVSRILRVLVKQRRVIYSGTKVESTKGGRLDSAVWKTVAVATPAERAAAGLPIDDDNYAGTTTRWPNAATTPGLGRVTIESSQFESKR